MTATVNCGPACEDGMVTSDVGAACVIPGFIVIDAITDGSGLGTLENNDVGVGSDAGLLVLHATSESKRAQRGMMEWFMANGP